MTEQILKQNSTHKAVKEGEKIKIFIKGFEFEGETFQDEFLYSIPAGCEDDLLGIFEMFDETNRVYANEFAEEMKGQLK